MTAIATAGRQRLGHLVGRFFGSLRPRALSGREMEWVASILTPPEYALFLRMGRADRREGYVTARRAETALRASRGDADPQWIAAALLHDVGKLDTQFGPFRRSLATVIGLMVGDARIGTWRNRGGMLRRVSYYLQHSELGADRIRVVGGRDPAARWAAVHHRPTEWASAGIPDDVGQILAWADGEVVRGTAG